MRFALGFLILVVGLLITNDMVDFENNREALIAFCLGLVSCLFALIVICSESINHG